jgi:hypothetical protein
MKATPIVPVPPSAAGASNPAAAVPAASAADLVATAPAPVDLDARHKVQAVAPGTDGQTADRIVAAWRRGVIV